MISKTSTRFVCSEAYGKVPIARCDNLRLVGPQKTVLGKEKRLRKENVTMWSIGHMRGLRHGTGDESTHQILSYGLLFLTFYRFPYTAGPPTSTAPMRPSPTFAITADYTLCPSHHRPGTTSETFHMTYGPHCYIFLS